MRDRRFVIGLLLLLALVVMVVMFGGRLEDLLLRLHGVHRE
jgi:hypothetical protein